MNDETLQHAHDRSVSKARFLAKFQRYGNLLRKKWWIVALCLALGLGVQTIFVLQGTGADPDYTQTFLQACMEEYVSLKREMRVHTSDTTFAGLTEEVLRLKEDLRKSDEDMVQFQSTNSVVLLQDQGNSAGNYLGALNNRLASLKSEYELLQTLTLDQNLDRQQQLSGALPANELADRPTQGAAERLDADYLRAKQQILLLKADQQ